MTEETIDRSARDTRAGTPGYDWHRSFTHKEMLDLRTVVRGAIDSAEAELRALETERLGWCGPELQAQMTSDARKRLVALLGLRRAVR